MTSAALSAPLVLTTHPAPPGEAPYPSIDAAIQGARYDIVVLLKKFARPRMAAVLARIAAGRDPAGIALELGIDSEEIEFYLNPKAIAWLNKPGGFL